ncbi:MULTISPECIES: autotransporter outer membrane beta-barrel domain-containing protein [unclassified Brevundimonas]|uniref:autotransporter outer membrane beta-barrel domain-containing protein n=1 Tax=unclassified Brevundimonas TaxID=2622653 RepID=UPI0025B9AFAB|nr:MULTISPECIES: autotransporter domain-containing protein [unclassified Brevundimonas]
MRALLVTAAAIAPLTVASGAWAETVVSTARTTPIATATATGSAPDDIRMSNAGSIAIASGVAVRVNSSNGFDMDSGSSITMDKSENGSTAVLVEGGYNSPVTIGGRIAVNDKLETAPDTNDDGIPDGPFAEGQDRYGLRVTGPGVSRGNILIENSGTIAVEGNNSRAVSIESDRQGNFTSYGQVSVTGDNSTAIHIGGATTGNVDILGTVNAKGENAQGVVVEGDVTGRANIQGAITATGYRYNTRPPNAPETNANPKGVYLEKLDEDDLLQGGPAVSIAANLSQGLILDSGPTYGPGGIEGDDDDNGVKNGDEDDDGDGIKNREDPDRDGDGLTDAQEGRANIVAYGAAPALQVGSANRDITLGNVGTGENAYGLINRGQISAFGVYDDVDATALRVGVDGGQAVTIDGGFRNQGDIVAVATEGSATAVRLGAGASTPQLNNSGLIRATATTKSADQVSGIQLDAGSNLTSLTNSGTIQADVSGGKASATAINDLSGTLTSVTNTGNITAVVGPRDDADTVTGVATAINASNNTTGFTFVQDKPAGTATTSEGGDIQIGSTAEAGARTTGNIRLGSGNDVIDIRNGTVNGDISFGTGADTLRISGGATVAGALDTGDGRLNIDIGKGTLDARQTGTTNVTGLNIGNEGTLIVSLDPSKGTAGGFKVNGAANLADGANLGVRFDTLLQDETRFTIIDADTLTLGGDIKDLILDENAPYAYVVESDADTAAGQVYIDARRRTASEAGMIGVEAQAYDVLYQGLAENEVIRRALLGQTTRDGFFDLYEQMLPDHSGGPLMSLASGVDAVTRALTGRNASAAQGETSAWLQEINFYADKDKTDSYGFRSEGFGVAGGVERGTKAGAFGVSAAFTSSDIEDPESAAEEVLSANLLELGLYWRAQGQNWTTWARAAGGYAQFEATRRLVADGVNLKNESDWNGFTLSAAAGASYEKHYGRLNVRPEVYAEYFSLSEDGRSESGGGDGFDLEINDRDSHIASGVAALNIGYGFGQNGWVRPEVRIGYRHILSMDAGETVARFKSGGDYFRLKADGIEGGGPILGFRLNVGNDLGMLSITGDAELLEDYVRYTLLLRASFKF